jgi:hypothetical protein
MLESLLVTIPPATRAIIMIQMITGITLWKICQRAPLPTKAGIIMTIPIPNFLASSIHTSGPVICWSDKAEEPISQANQRIKPDL